MALFFLHFQIRSLYRRFDILRVNTIFLSHFAHLGGDHDHFTTVGYCSREPAMSSGFV